MIEPHFILWEDNWSCWNEISRLGKPVVLVLIKGRPLLMEGAIQEAEAIVDAVSGHAGREA